jgi:fluoride exporter
VENFGGLRAEGWSALTTLISYLFEKDCANFRKAKQSWIGESENDQILDGWTRRIFRIDRAILGGVVHHVPDGRAISFGTFIINISGSFLIGLIVTLLAERTHWSANLLYLIPIGFIGAYTTFSTFELEAFRSVRGGDALLALLYVVLSVCVGFVAVWLGILSGRALE